MSKLNCTVFDKKSNKNKVVGYMELKNKTETTNASLNIYGDIVSDKWSKWCDDDTCPQDVSDFLKELDNSEDLDIYVNSGGGSVFAGIAIYNQLKRHTGNKVVHIDGIAASIASVIACAGDKIIIPKASQFMIHKPFSSYFFSCMNADDLRKDAEMLDKCQESITAVYMDNVKEGVTEETITNLINAESWFTGNGVTEYFNFEVEEGAEAVACTSEYYNKYYNTPKNLKTTDKQNQKTSNSIDIKEIVNAVINEIDSKKAQDRKEIADNILKDLDQYGV